MMLRTAIAVGIFNVASALPGDDLVAERIAAFHNGTEEEKPTDPKPTKKYERIVPTQPGYQWNDHGGYCGSWSIQRAAMAKGAWISQQQVRDHTVKGGGNDNEILATNIELALKNLKLSFEGFDYKNLPTPQLDSGRKWMKQQLVAGNALVQMIMLPGHNFPVYPGLPYGTYSHIEPIVGIMSDHPLTDDDFYDDDYIVHYNDAGTDPLYRSMSSLPGKMIASVSCCPDAGDFPDSMMCLHPQNVFSWAIQGLQDSKEGLPLSLAVDQWQEEPDTRTGASPTEMTGTITIEDLKVGKAYALYRWDSVESAFDYSQPAVYRFSATKTTEVYTDPKTFSSDGTIYYRCIADEDVVV